MSEDDIHSNVIYQFELISTIEPTIHITEGPKAFFMENDNSIKMELLDQMNNKWEDIADLEPELQHSIKSMRPKLQKVLTVVLGVDILVAGILVVLRETVLSSNKPVVRLSFFGFILLGLIQTVILLLYLYRALRQYTADMEQWRKLFNNQMVYYLENTVIPSYSGRNWNYGLTIHQTETGHKLYVVLSYGRKSHGSMLGNYRDERRKQKHKEPLLWSESDQYSAV